MTRRWLATECAYGKVIGRREFASEEAANKTAATWRSQNAGVVRVEKVEVET